MRIALLALLLAAVALTATAGEGYTLQNSQNIMHFVAVDQDRAKDVATYRKAIEDLCKPDTKCQVLFWVGEAPNGLPMTREQHRAQVAYWQFDKRSGDHRLYVDCDFFGEIEDSECL